MRTAKLLNSNSLIGTINRFGWSVELVKNFIINLNWLHLTSKVDGGRKGFYCTCARSAFAPFEAVRGSEKNRP
jgi:hypothetical protein